MSIATTAQDQAYLRFQGIGKTFPGVRALDDLSFSANAGGVHALLGENGAGKSTLLKILGGMYAPDSGSISIGGAERILRSPQDAFKAGVAIIHQELQLVPELSVAENMFLGHFPTRHGILQRSRLRVAAAELLRRLGESISPTAKISSLSIAQRQMVEIAKALSRDAKIIAFDEPTSSLSDREVRRLFTTIGELKRQGRVILYISHRMEEIFTICDTATVLRDGRHVCSYATLAGLTADRLIRDMVGREIKDVYAYKPRSLGPPILELAALEAPGLTAPASLRVARGEIVGIFGLVGSGRSELLRAIFGATRSTAGSLKVDGQTVAIRTPADAIRAGIMFCPEDRKASGIFPLASVQDNINISARRHHLWGHLAVNNTWERDNATQSVTKLAIKTPSARQLVGNLSGGNQQKVILARWLSENVRVMLLDEPTRGIDIGAKHEIYAIVQALAAKGVGTLLVSADLPEVLGLADRVVVMCEGRISGALDRHAATSEAVMRLALPRASSPGTAPDPIVSP